MPMTWGIFRPVVCCQLRPSLAGGRLPRVVLHELAHVARRDCLTLAISELTLACTGSSTGVVGREPHAASASRPATTGCSG